MFRFEKLDVWHKAVDFADHVYSTTKAFSSEELFGLTSPMRRAAVSISSNVAEGSGRPPDRESAHFVGTAYGSLVEVLSPMHVAQRRKFATVAQSEELRERAEELKDAERPQKITFHLGGQIRLLTLDS